METEWATREKISPSPGVKLGVARKVFGLQSLWAWQFVFSVVSLTDTSCLVCRTESYSEPVMPLYTFIQSFHFPKQFPSVESINPVKTEFLLNNI
jgi:hypothetical protein